MPAESTGALFSATFSAIVGGVAGALVAGIFNFFAVKKNRIDIKLDALENALVTFRDAAVTYWRSQGMNDGLERQIITLSESLDLRVSALEKHGFKKHNIQAARNLAIELWEVSTSGTFQTKNRQRDRDKVDKIRSLCDRILSTVS